MLLFWRNLGFAGDGYGSETDFWRFLQIHLFGFGLEGGQLPADDQDG